ncbi:hypothetical protein D1BOALGB6SA_1054, partial [Olavius sp. associated proteobacterium Delta 1]
MKKIHKILQIVLISAIALLTIGSAAHAQYNFNKKITVDHTRVFGIPYGYDYMKKITIDAARVGGTDAPPAGFSAVKKITVNNANVSGSTDLTDFPVLVSISGDAGLRTTAQGGEVTDSQGDDIIFYDQTLSSQLDHEVESYDGTTGTLVAWVRIPSLKATQDTVFYLAYGNSSISSSQEDVPGVWDANYKGVWHLEEDVTDEQTSGTHDDSTSNGNDGSQNENVEATGKIADGQDFDGNDDYVNLSDVDLLAADFTLNAWIKPNVGSGERFVIGKEREGEANYQFRWFLDTNDYLLFMISNFNNSDSLWTGSYNLRSPNRLTENSWTHVAVTRSGTNYALYIDAQSVDTASTSTVINHNNSHDMLIGARISAFGPPDQLFDGSIDEVRISSTARSDDWIKTNYNNQSDPAGFMTIEDGGSGSGDHENFPVLVSLTSDDLKSPGRVTSAGGHDIIFMDSALGAKLDHEVESYDAASGTLLAWVRVPLLKVSEDTVLYLCYGNSSVTASQENAAGVWDADYKGVWHMEG